MAFSTHLSPITNRIMNCSARPGMCRFSSTNEHMFFENNKDFEEYNELIEAVNNNGAFNNGVTEEELERINNIEEKSKEICEKYYPNNFVSYTGIKNDKLNRANFFSKVDKNYTLVNNSDGYVLSDNCVVLDGSKIPEDVDLEQDFDDYEDLAVPIRESSKLIKTFKEPIIFEVETGAITSAEDLYAIDLSKNIDEENFESYSAASNFTEKNGFKLFPKSDSSSDEYKEFSNNKTNYENKLVENYSNEKISNEDLKNSFDKGQISNRLFNKIKK